MNKKINVKLQFLTCFTSSILLLLKSTSFKLFNHIIGCIPRVDFSPLYAKLNFSTLFPYLRPASN